MDADVIREKVATLMPEVQEDLSRLIGHPSVAFSGYSTEPVQEAARTTREILGRYGLPNARLLDIQGGYPAVYGEIPAPSGAPTVLLYAHYDVQPARKEDGWTLDPWTAVVRDGRLFGRGAADNKSGVLAIAATLKVFGGTPPVGVKVIIEGEEETRSHLEEYIRAHPDLFRCDLFVISDNGNLRVGEPALTTTLRGTVSCIARLRTLDHPVHSGSFGGPVPDALVSLCRMIATLHDPEGTVAVPGLSVASSPEGTFPEDLFRRTSGLLPGVELIGSGSLASRLWSQPSVSVIGIDAPSVADSANILIPAASAKISLRIAPGADPKEELRRLTDHLRAVAPWHVHLEIEPLDISPGFICPTGGPFYQAARRAMEMAFRNPVTEIGAGGSIPLLNTLQGTSPNAGFVLWGAEDLARSHIHGPDESVDLEELENLIVAQCLLLQSVGQDMNP